MPHGIWKGDISFGLVYIPVTLYSAESHRCNVKMHLLDKRDLSPVGYAKINKNTGEKVPLEHLVEGYEYEDNNYVVLSREELKKMHPASTQSIEIIEFVDINKIQTEYFEKPYYLVPDKKGIKGFVLLREAMRKTHKAAIAKVVIRTRQYLAAVIVEGKAMLLELLHFPCELVNSEQFNFPATNLTELNIKKTELTMAEELVKTMSTTWNPGKYKNEYQGELLDLVMERIKMGKSYAIKETKKEPAHLEKKGKVVDLMSLLKKSMAQKNSATRARTQRRVATRRKHS